MRRRLPACRAAGRRLPGRRRRRLTGAFAGLAGYGRGAFRGGRFLHVPSAKLRHVDHKGIGRMSGNAGGRDEEREPAAQISSVMIRVRMAASISFKWLSREQKRRRTSSLREQAGQVPGAVLDEGARAMCRSLRALMIFGVAARAPVSITRRGAPAWPRRCDRSWRVVRSPRLARFDLAEWQARFVHRALEAPVTRARLLGKRGAGDGRAGDPSQDRPEAFWRVLEPAGIARRVKVGIKRIARNVNADGNLCPPFCPCLSCGPQIPWIRGGRGDSRGRSRSGPERQKLLDRKDAALAAVREVSLPAAVPDLPIDGQVSGQARGDGAGEKSSPRRT